MAENFMTAGTKIEDLVTTKNQIIDKVARILAETTISYMSAGKTTSISNDIEKLLTAFSAEEKNKIYALCLGYIATSKATTKDTIKKESFRGGNKRSSTWDF